jgi:hypothetical protein
MMIFLVVQGFRQGGLASSHRTLLCVPTALFGIAFCGFMLLASICMIESTPWF